MARYSVKRLLQSVITLFIVISVVFLLLRLMPIRGYFPDGDWMKLSDDAKTGVLVKLGIYGEDGNPLNPFVQLFNYYVNLFSTGDFGVSTSLYPGVQVMQIITEKMPLSMTFGLVAFVISIVFGFVLGVFMAKYKNGIVDALGMAYIVVVTSVPALVYFFMVQFYVTKWLDASMIYRPGDFKTCIAPIVCITLASIAGNALWIRRYMVDEINKDYVKLAYAKGLPSSTVMFRHVLRNACVPLAYTIPLGLISVLSGSLVMEKLFSIPGMGRLLVDAIGKRDNNFVQTLVFIYSALGIMGVFLGDMFAMLVDPRIKIQGKGGTR